MGEKEWVTSSLGKVEEEEKSGPKKTHRGWREKKTGKLSHEIRKEKTQTRQGGSWTNEKRR